MNVPFKPGEHQVARCPGPGPQDIIREDGDTPPAAYTLEAYQYLGDDDIPFERYASPEFFKLEMERMWPRVWQWACREEHIPEAGDYQVYDIGPHSFIVVRTNNGDIKAYYNACLHRGTKLRPSGTEGATNDLRCPYHGWTWSLEGELKTVPCKWDFAHVDPAKFSLPEVRVETWAGFVFINMDENAPSLAEYMAPLGEHAAGAAFEDRYIALHVQKELPCNWKVAQEAFMESYHVLETHPQLLAGVGDANGQYDILSDHVNRLYVPAGVASPHLDGKASKMDILNSMPLGDRSQVEDIIANSGDLNPRKIMADAFKDLVEKGCGRDMSGYSTAEMIDTLGYLLFPNTHLFLAVSFPIVYRFRPLGMQHDKTLFDLMLFNPVPKDGERPAPAEPTYLKVEQSYCEAPGMDPGMGVIYDQDTGNMGWMQEGFGSAKKKAATLATYQEVRIRHMHMVLDKYLERPVEG